MSLLITDETVLEILRGLAGQLDQPEHAALVADLGAALDER